MKIPFISTHRVLEYLYFRDKRLLFLLVTGPRFRLVFLFCLAIAFGTPLAMLKCLDSTPSYVRPEFKMSLIDLIQAKALARSARALPDDTAPDKRFGHWRQAIGNHPGDAELNRDYLENLLAHDRTRHFWHDALRTSMWIQNLSQTNRADLELACQTFDHYWMNHRILHAVEAFQGQASPSLQSVYLKALFRQGQLDLFDNTWNESSPSLQNHPNLKLYRMAFTATLPHKKTQNQGQAALDQAKTKAPTEELAHRLQLRVSYENNEPIGFLNSFTRLLDKFQTVTSDHILHWRLLEKLGQRQAAREAAQLAIIRPRTAMEVVDIADALIQLELRELGMRYLQAYAVEFGFAEANWCAQADIISHEDDWDALVRLALKIRSSHDVSAPMLAYSYYLQGKGELERGRMQDAKDAFQAIEGEDLSESQFSLYVASNLWKFGFPEKAFETLWPEQNRYRNHPSYWELLLSISEALSRQGPLFLAAENLYRLHPENLRYQVNYASLLMSQRIQLEEALALTYKAFLSEPTNESIRINYGQALLMTGRPKEAGKILRDVSVSNLDSRRRQAYYSAWTELLYTEEKYEDALIVAKEVIPELLLPGDRVFFHRILDDLTRIAEG